MFGKTTSNHKYDDIIWAKLILFSKGYIMNDNCQIPNCKKKAKIYRIESKIQHGINLNKVVFHFCDNHKETEIKDFIEDKCSKKSLKKQIVNPFVDVENLIK